MNKQLKDYLDKQEDAILEAGLKGLALLALLALIMVLAGVVLIYAGW